MSKSDETFSVETKISKLKSIKYFTPAKSIEEANSLVSKVKEIVSKYSDDLMPWKRENDTIQHASDLLWDLARVKAMVLERRNLWDSAWDHAWKEASGSARDNYGWYGGAYVSGETARDAARDAAKYASRYISFEVAKDRLGGQNPFENIIELYSYGLKPTYFRKIGDKERFVVDFPLKVDNKFLLGCFAHGDKEILFTHEWKDYCTNLKPIKEQDSRIIL